jgi:hypothetical protein
VAILPPIEPLSRSGLSGPSIEFSRFGPSYLSDPLSSPSAKRQVSLEDFQPDDIPEVRIHIPQEVKEEAPPESQPQSARIRINKCTSFCNGLKSASWGAVRVLIGHAVLGQGLAAVTRYGVEYGLLTGAVSAEVAEPFMDVPLVLTICAAGWHSGELICYRLVDAPSRCTVLFSKTAAAIGGGVMPYVLALLVVHRQAGQEDGQTLTMLKCLALLAILTRLESQLIRDGSNVTLKKVVGSHVVVGEDGQTFEDQSTLMRLQLCALLPAMVMYGLGGLAHQMVGKPYLSQLIEHLSGSATFGRLAGPAASSIGLELADEFNQVWFLFLLCNLKGLRLGYEPAGGFKQLGINLKQLAKGETWSQIWDHAAMRIFGFGAAEALANQASVETAHKFAYLEAAGPAMGPAELRAHFAYHGDRIKVARKLAERLKAEKAGNPLKKVLDHQNDYPGQAMPDVNIALRRTLQRQQSQRSQAQRKGDAARNDELISVLVSTIDAMPPWHVNSGALEASRASEAQSLMRSRLPRLEESKSRRSEESKH